MVHNAHVEPAEERKHGRARARGPEAWGFMAFASYTSHIRVELGPIIPDVRLLWVKKLLKLG